MEKEHPYNVSYISNNQVWSQSYSKILFCQISYNPVGLGLTVYDTYFFSFFGQQNKDIEIKYQFAYYAHDPDSIGQVMPPGSVSVTKPESISLYKLSAQAWKS